MPAALSAVATQAPTADAKAKVEKLREKLLQLKKGTGQEVAAEPSEATDATADGAQGTASDSVASFLSEAANRQRLRALAQELAKKRGSQAAAPAASAWKARLTPAPAEEKVAVEVGNQGDGLLDDFVARSKVAVESKDSPQPKQKNGGAVADERRKKKVKKEKRRRKEAEAGPEEQEPPTDQLALTEEEEETEENRHLDEDEEYVQTEEAEQSGEAAEEALDSGCLRLTLPRCLVNRSLYPLRREEGVHACVKWAALAAPPCGDVFGVFKTISGHRRLQDQRLA
ncbi:unnamed protein product [Symbiodinium sp. CCMP2456]|nr:unnamed protein product [Symbiodinium sp. CCMP2456]